LRRRKSIYHAMPRLKCLFALASTIKCHIAILGSTHASIHAAIRSRGLSARSGSDSLLYDSPRRRKGGSRLKLALSGPKWPGINSLALSGAAPFAQSAQSLLQNYNTFLQ
jgi:hypothetical protein